MNEIKFSNINGIKLGHAGSTVSGTGCTVIICEKGASSGVDVRGGAPGTRETDLLDPSEMVQKVHSIVLSGGSAYGLDACSGVMKYLEEKDIGLDVGNVKVPIVCGAVIFDLGIGDSKVRPDSKMGYEACLNSENYADDIQGNIGGGIGATVGKILGKSSSMKGGLGSYAVNHNGLQVGAIVLVNAMGDVICPETNKKIAAPLDSHYNFLSTEEIMINSYPLSPEVPMGNTTIACIVTNARFTKAEAKKISSMAHNGLARSIFPCHTMFDGDTIFTMSTGEVTADINLVGVLAKKCIEKAIVRGVKSASTLFNTPSFLDVISMK